LKEVEIRGRAVVRGKKKKGIMGEKCFEVGKQKARRRSWDDRGKVKAGWTGSRTRPQEKGGERGAQFFNLGGGRENRGRKATEFARVWEKKGAGEGT